MAESEKYNGWANYETWVCHLWLTNEESTYNYVKQQLKNLTNPTIRAYEEELESLISEDEIFDKLKNYGLMKDLLHHAIGKIDLNEIVMHFIDDFELPLYELQKIGWNNETKQVDYRIVNLRG